MKLDKMCKKLKEVNKEILEISKLGQNRIKIIFKCASAANSVVKYFFFVENELVAYIHTIQALFRHVDTRISEPN